MFTDDGTTYTFSTVSACKDATCISNSNKKWVDQHKEMDDSCYSMALQCQDKSKCKQVKDRCLVNTWCTDNIFLPGTGQGCKKSCDGNTLCGCHPDNGKCYKGNEDPRCNWISNGDACV